ncbi:PTS sugar transporter subunit IIB [Dorea ammoniilytica]|uniref:PTS sugar transporter subunit IIB n=1 Tax=Dorea ammoniilytica TaxID=2981788 RepID=A0ABT2S4P0_9FIRM|nr:PTS sugar transporter subunit IIB [Dorea ammoniilytica]MCU6699557.1 PTS sugar transporter subunit IIB [Dorea ammoniilytica]SCH39082.1 Fructose-specific phosphotransferase enzyme IIB component [uncultured Eubacterium sp.]
MNEIFFRVDERLVHGQILFKWLEHASCSKLYIIDDQVATDPILQGVLTMTVPESVEVFFYSTDEGAEAVMIADANVLVLLRTLDTLWRIYEKGTEIKTVNICRLPFAPGKKELYENIYVSGHEEEIIKSLTEDGTVLYIQMVPDNEVVYIRDLI